MKSFKRDISPICFYFDVLKSDFFKIPIMPIPMRIDKVTNGDPTLFILPDFTKLEDLYNKLNYYLDFEKFLNIGIENLIIYAKEKYSENNYRVLKRSTITKWFNKSIDIATNIPDLSESFTFLISEFLTLYTNIEKQGLISESDEYRSELIQYCDKMISYFRDKIEQNSFKIQSKGEIQIVNLYSEKKNQYHPQITPIDIFDVKINRIKKMFFVPYLIYDDLLDCFFYDKKILAEEKKKKKLYKFT